MPQPISVANFAHFKSQFYKATLWKVESVELATLLLNTAAPLCFIYSFLKNFFHLQWGQSHQFWKVCTKQLCPVIKLEWGETNETIDKTPERRRRPTYFFRLCLEAKCGAMTMRRPLFIQPVFGENIWLDAGEMTDLAFFFSKMKWLQAAGKANWRLLLLEPFSNKSRKYHSSSVMRHISNESWHLADRSIDVEGSLFLACCRFFPNISLGRPLTRDNF